LCLSLLCLLSLSLFLTVDQGMFENSVAQQQSPQTSRPGLPSARRSPASANPNLGSGSADSPSSGGQQRLKNAINLGKAVGAKVNDLLRRKEPSHLGDIGVTEVNKSVGAPFCFLTLSSSHISSFDSFPRLDPPPPSGKKRLPRALKTTQDMMISSDPVVSSPDAADTSSFLSSPEKTPADGVVDGGEEDVESTKEGAEEHQTQLQLSVPDLINKDPPQLETRAKPCDVWQKAPGPDSRLASTPRSGKTPCRISLGEEVLLGNGAPCSKVTGVSAEDSEHHPDLLSFE
uniref:Nitric oxide synthase 1 (neuronal) adaptor protein a n=1 Tax=Labrus bergylta TaxID=56723 RepID=A0A3Q3MGR5_9LABR